MPALGWNAHSPVLEEELATNPAFFVEVLSLVMRPAHGEQAAATVSQAQVSNAYRLLESWKRVPGASSDGSIDAGRLRGWVAEARRLLAEADRLEVGEQYIGKVLSHAGPDADGAWPARPVRDLIDELGAPQVERGFYLGVVNSRGVTTRGVFDGGAQEYELADKYGGWATALAARWPRTAAVLRQLETIYREDGRQHDLETERLRQGLGD
jgi:hypothetical protein